MYSDISVEDRDVFYADDESVDSCDTALGAAERWIEDNEASEYHWWYAALFEMPGCPYETAAKRLCRNGPARKRVLADHNLTGLLDISTVDLDSMKWAEASRGAQPLPTIKAHAPSAMDAQPALGGRVDCTDGTWYEAKHSRVSRFLEDNLAQCVLFPIPVDVNRAALEARHADELALQGVRDTEIHVAYRGREAVGWALPLTTDPNVLMFFRSHYAGCRKATADDVCLFGKWVHLSGTGVRVTSNANDSGVPAVGPGTRISAYISQHNGSADQLLAAVRRAGGWGNVNFVAIDVEAFAVSKGGEPLPAEISLQVCNPFSGKVRPDFHCYVHPGTLDMRTLRKAQYTATHVHFIPYENAPFLGRNYKSMAKVLSKKVLKPKNVILINKGAIMDVEALLWVFAVASLQEREASRKKICVADISLSDPLFVPTLDELSCFDITALKSALEQAFPGVHAASTRKTPFSKVRPCRYHRSMKNCILKDDGLCMGGDGPDAVKVHCAQEDAGHLREDIRSLLCAYKIGSWEG